MTSPPAYDAFLSYNSLDHAIVERVAKELGHRQCKCFVDRWYLEPGKDWVAALERALSGSRSVAIFIGPHEMGRWQQRERAWALDQLAGRNDFPVIPVLLPGCEPPLGFMQQLMWIDLRNDPPDSGQLDALAAAIRGETVNREGKPEPRAMICPYRGLLAFREEDADFFFGREVYQQQLLNLIEHQSLVAVIGASGSGKSSLVSAGLIPALRRKANGPVWDVVRMVPHVDPLYSLAEAFVPLIDPELSKLALERELNAVAQDLEQAMPTTPLWGLVNAVLRQQPGTQRLLLFVDQWEELYTNCEKPTRRDRFIEELLEATSRKDSPLSVVLTVRGDFYNEILRNRPLLDRIQSGRLDLGPMNSAELRSAIEGPGKNVGLTFEPGLADRILKEAGDEPGSLPLLEFALEELWKRRDHSLLTHAGYEDLGQQSGQLGQQSGQQDESLQTEKAGPLSRAIATYAEGIYKTLTPDEQQSLPALFRRLVRAGAKTEDDTRRRVELSELDETTRLVVRKLAKSRLLMTTGSEGVDSSGVNKPVDNQGSRPANDLNTELRTETEIGGARFHRAGHVKNVPHVQKTTVISAPVLAARTTVEVAHEELLRRWGRLKGWVNEDRKFLLWRSRLDLKVEEFQRDGDVSLLLGTPLQVAQEFYPARKNDLDDGQRKFLDASLGAEGERLKSARQRKRRIWIGACVVAVAAISITMGVYYAQQKTTAKGLMEKYVATSWDQTAVDFELLIEPYHRYVIEPLHLVFDEKGRTDVHKLNAAYALARLDATQPEELKILLEAIPNAKPEHREKNFDLALRAVRDRNLWQGLLVELAKQPVTIGSYRYGLTELTRDFTSPATIVTQFDADPTDRTDWIHLWDEWPVDIETVLGILADTKTDDGLRSALFCVIGLHSQDKAWVAKREKFISRLNEAYKTSEEPGLHFIAEWALHKWNAIPENIIATRAGKWEANSQKMTMIWIKDGTFMMGTDGGDEPSESPRHEVEVLNGFYLSNREVSVEQFKRFVDDADYTGPRLVDWEGYDKEYSPDDRCPVQKVSWLDAVRYCNWLSHKEGLNIAYDEQEWKPIPGANGYRLPTEAEWEYACRAGTDTEYASGNTVEALADYAVFQEQTTQPCGSRIPNAWGLFDMHGNVFEWCEDTYRASYATDAEIDENSRVLRGGSFYGSDPQFLRSAVRILGSPDIRYYSVGFRISRTP